MAWENYELIDSGGGRRLERFGRYILDRPDPQTIWAPQRPEVWSQADAIFDKTWVKRTDMPDTWPVQWKELTFMARLSPFKHTGIFAEQDWQWDFIKAQCAVSPGFSVLNLFGYTGTAALVAASAGATVTYVDASRQALTWARKNQEASGLLSAPVRWILDDVTKFVGREVRRGVKYDCLIMDPPVFGHGPEGETWQFNKSLPKLLELCRQLLSDHPRFILINAYAISSSAFMLQNMLQDLMRDYSGSIKSGELVINSGNRVLSTGIWSTWECN